MLAKFTQLARISLRSLGKKCFKYSVAGGMIRYLILSSPFRNRTLRSKYENTSSTHTPSIPSADELISSFYREVEKSAFLRVPSFIRLSFKWNVKRHLYSECDDCDPRCIVAFHRLHFCSIMAVVQKNNLSKKIIDKSSRHRFFFVRRSIPAP